MINIVHDHIQNGTPAPPPKKQVDPSLNQCCIHKSTKGSTTGILTREAEGINNVMPFYHFQWVTKTDMSTLQMDNKLLHYLYNIFGPVVHFCPEYKRDIIHSDVIQIMVQLGQSMIELISNSTLGCFPVNLRLWCFMTPLLQKKCI